MIFVWRRKRKKNKKKVGANEKRGERKNQSKIMVEVQQATVGHGTLTMKKKWKKGK